MKKNLNLIPHLISLSFLVLILFFAADVFAVPQTAPPANPPSSNPAVPIYTEGDQVKFGGLSVGTFQANQNASFNKDAFFPGFLIGKPASGGISKINFGGLENGILRAVDVLVNGSVLTSGNFYAENISGNQTTGLCADKEGIIVNCDLSTPPPPSPQNPVISGHINYECHDTQQAGNDHKQGNATIKFTLDKALPQALSLDMTECSIHPGSAYPGPPHLCQGRMLSTPPLGYNFNPYPIPQGYSFYITIPAGVKEYTTPKPLLGSDTGSMRFYCEQRGPRRGAISRATYLYFKLANLTNYDFKFTGWSYSRNSNDPAKPIIIIRLP